MKPPTLEDRTSGVLLHVTSLPGPFFNGDLGASARRFVDFLSKTDQRWWQVLPINPIGLGDSPYSTTCTLAYEPLLLGLDGFVRDGLVKRRALASPPRGASRSVDYRRARRFRQTYWRQAFEAFCGQAGRSLRRAFNKFCRQTGWLDDFTLFHALSDHYGGKPWSTWPDELVRRRPAALRKARTEFAESIEYLAFLQFMFHRQWQDLRQYSRDRGVGILGDVPIFVDYASADVWANQDLFWLGKDRRPTYVSGAPPDAFNRNGQLWGHALYRWDVMKRRGFKWWVDRLRHALSLFDAVRLDHFIGFHNYWQVSGTARTAKGGKWVRAAGAQLFSKLQSELGALPFVAEDLGQATPEVWALRDRFGFPGMRVLQFGFNREDGGDYHMPHRCERNNVVYTGTHDNDTTVGWFRSLARQGQGHRRENIRRLLGNHGREVHWDFIRLAMTSVSNVAIFPVQDLLGLGASARMNTPGVAKGNWRWRLAEGDLDGDIARRLRELTRISGRV